MLVLVRLMLAIVFALGLFPLGSSYAKEEEPCSPLDGCFTFQGQPSEIARTYPMVKFTSAITTTLSWGKGVFSPTFTSASGYIYTPYPKQYRAFLPPGTWTMAGYTLYISPEDPTFQIIGNKSTRVFALESGVYFTNTVFHTFKVESDTWTPLGTILSITDTIKLMWENEVEVAVMQGEIEYPFAPEMSGKGWGIWNQNPKANVPDYSHPDLRYLAARGHGMVSIYAKSEIDLYRSFAVEGQIPYILDNNEYIGQTSELFYPRFVNKIHAWPIKVQEGGNWIVSIFDVNSPDKYEKIYHINFPVDSKVYVYSEGEVFLFTSPMFMDYPLNLHKRADGWSFLDENESPNRTGWIHAQGKGLVIIAHTTTIKGGYMDEGVHNLSVAYVTNDLPSVSK